MGHLRTLSLTSGDPFLLILRLRLLLLNFLFFFQFSECEFPHRAFGLMAVFKWMQAAPPPSYMMAATSEGTVAEKELFISQFNRVKPGIKLLMRRNNPTHPLSHRTPVLL